MFIRIGSSVSLRESTKLSMSARSYRRSRSHKFEFRVDEKIKILNFTNFLKCVKYNKTEKL